MTASPGPTVRRPRRAVRPALPRAYPAGWEIDAVLSDGGAVHVRPIRPDDREALVAFHEGLSPETQYFRFFSPKPHLTAADVERFTSVDYVDRMALVAELHDAIVAVGRYDRVPGTVEAEVAFVVDDRHQGRGLGTLLLEYLAGLARERGIVRFVAETLFGNRRMLTVFRDAGFRETTRVESGTVRVVLDIVATEASERAADEREWEADVASVERLLRPGSVAVVGAGRDPSGTGHAVLRKLLDGGFAGPVHPVNPHAAEIAGRTAYPTVSAVPEPVDLAVVCVPAAAVPGVVDDCAAAGVKGLVVISSGFAETGAAGAALQRDVVERAHRGGMRLIGPNCIGVVNTDPGVRMDATFAPARPVPGRIGFASQSGALGIAMLERARGKGLGLSTFVSMGNKADVSGNDVLRFWEGDPGTDVVLLYLESFGNPRAFSRVARRVSRSKPVVAVKSGRSASGVRGARSHTAAMASPDTAVDALFLQTGVIRVDTLEQLFDVGDVLAHQPLPRGDRAAVVGNAGGAAILAADALEAAGLVVPELSERTQAAIRAACPSAAGTSNPVDLGAAASPAAFASTVRAVLDDGGVDSLLVVHAPVPQVPSEEIGAAVRTASAGDRPVVAVFLAMDRPPETVEAEGTRIPSFAFPEPAAQALARVVAYARWRERPPGGAPALSGVDHDAAAAVVADTLHRSPDGGWLDSPEAAALLGAYGIPVATTVRVAGAVEAVAAAAAVGYPVALKVAAGSFVHKTDVGGVRLGLADAAAVRAAYEDLAARLGDEMGDAVVQPMLDPGVETIVGVVNDPLFGPLVMFGSGGVAAEVFGDRAFRVLPLTDVDAHELVRSTRGSPLLFGHRGAPAADVAGLEDLLLRVGCLAEAFPELAEMDLNPVIVSPEGAVAVDAKVRIVPHTPHPELEVRRLRDPRG